DAGHDQGGHFIEQPLPPVLAERIAEGGRRGRLALFDGLLLEDRDEGVSQRGHDEEEADDQQQQIQGIARRGGHVSREEEKPRNTRKTRKQDRKQVEPTFFFCFPSVCSVVSPLLFLLPQLPTTHTLSARVYGTSSSGRNHSAISALAFSGLSLP